MPATRLTSTGTYLVKGYFDEVSTVPQFQYTAQYLVVGGGGGGGSFTAVGGGGGGGGGITEGATVISSNQTFNITVGVGGSGGGTTGSPTIPAPGPYAGIYGGSPGSTSSIISNSGFIATIPGGQANNSGSAGGASGGGLNTGGAGGNINNSPGANGYLSTITNIYYGGGGGGGGSSPGAGNPGGNGGGGRGGQSGPGGPPWAGLPGTNGLGGGGGGDSWTSPAPGIIQDWFGGNGGTGTVALNVPTRYFPVAYITGSYTTSTSGTNTLITWATPGTYSASSNIIQYLVVGGGGGGSSNYTGGGGGGVTEGVASVSQGAVITVAVGTGGNGAYQPGYPSNSGNGNSSSVISSDSKINTTAGGGGGGDQGGTSGSPESYSAGTLQPGPSGWGAGGGGGGAGGNGSNGVISGSYQAGPGGVGYLSTTTGQYYGGGGGGYTSAPGQPYIRGTGGLGGGGSGGVPLTPQAAGAAGSPGTGGGGGGGIGLPAPTNPSGAGGPGVVVLKVPIATYSGKITGSYTTATSGTSILVTFTGPGTYTAGTMIAERLSVISTGSYVLQTQLQLDEVALTNQQYTVNYLLEGGQGGFGGNASSGYAGASPGGTGGYGGVTTGSAVIKIGDVISVTAGTGGAGGSNNYASPGQNAFFATFGGSGNSSVLSTPGGTVATIPGGGGGGNGTSGISPTTLNPFVSPGAPGTTGPGAGTVSNISGSSQTYGNATAQPGGPASPGSNQSGSSGVGILKIPTTYYSGRVTGGPQVTTFGTFTILTYSSPGTYQATSGVVRRYTTSSLQAMYFDEYSLNNYQYSAQYLLAGAPGGNGGNLSGASPQPGGAGGTGNALTGTTTLSAGIFLTVGIGTPGGQGGGFANPGSFPPSYSPFQGYEANPGGIGNSTTLSSPLGTIDTATGGVGGAGGVVLKDGTRTSTPGGAGTTVTSSIRGVSATYGSYAVGILQIPSEYYSGVVTGNPQITTFGAYTILSYYSTGTYKV